MPARLAINRLVIIAGNLGQTGRPPGNDRSGEGGRRAALFAAF